MGVLVRSNLPPKWPATCDLLGCISSSNFTRRLATRVWPLELSEYHHRLVTLPHQYSSNVVCVDHSELRVAAKGNDQWAPTFHEHYIGAGQIRIRVPVHSAV